MRYDNYDMQGDIRSKVSNDKYRAGFDAIDWGVKEEKPSCNIDGVGFIVTPCQDNDSLGKLNAELETVESMQRHLNDSLFPEASKLNPERILSLMKIDFKKYKTPRNCKWLIEKYQISSLEWGWLWNCNELTIGQASVMSDLGYNLIVPEEPA